MTRNPFMRLVALVLAASLMMDPITALGFVGAGPCACPKYHFIAGGDGAPPLQCQEPFTSQRFDSAHRDALSVVEGQALAGPGAGAFHPDREKGKLAASLARKMAAHLMQLAILRTTPVTSLLGLFDPDYWQRVWPHAARDAEAAAGIMRNILFLSEATWDDFIAVARDLRRGPHALSMLEEKIGYSFSARYRDLLELALSGPVQEDELTSQLCWVGNAAIHWASLKRLTHDYPEAGGPALNNFVSQSLSSAQMDALWRHWFGDHSRGLAARCDGLTRDRVIRLLAGILAMEHARTAIVRFTDPAVAQLEKQCEVAERRIRLASRRPNWMRDITALAARFWTPGVPLPDWIVQTGRRRYRFADRALNIQGDGQEGDALISLLVRRELIRQSLQGTGIHKKTLYRLLTSGKTLALVMHTLLEERESSLLGEKRLRRVLSESFETLISAVDGAPNADSDEAHRRAEACLVDGFDRLVQRFPDDHEIQELAPFVRAWVQHLAGPLMELPPRSVTEARRDLADARLDRKALVVPVRTADGQLAVKDIEASVRIELTRADIKRFDDRTFQGNPYQQKDPRQAELWSLFHLAMRLDGLSLQQAMDGNGLDRIVVERGTNNLVGETVFGDGVATIRVYERLEGLGEILTFIEEVTWLRLKRKGSQAQVTARTLKTFLWNLPYLIELTQPVFAAFDAALLSLDLGLSEGIGSFACKVLSDVPRYDIWGQLQVNGIYYDRRFWQFDSVKLAAAVEYILSEVNRRHPGVLQNQDGSVRHAMAVPAGGAPFADIAGLPSAGYVEPGVKENWNDVKTWRHALLSTDGRHLAVAAVAKTGAGSAHDSIAYIVEYVQDTATGRWISPVILGHYDDPVDAGFGFGPTRAEYFNPDFFYDNRGRLTFTSTFVRYGREEYSAHHSLPEISSHYRIYQSNPAERKAVITDQIVAYRDSGHALDGWAVRISPSRTRVLMPLLGWKGDMSKAFLVEGDFNAAQGAIADHAALNLVATDGEAIPGNTQPMNLYRGIDLRYESSGAILCTQENTRCRIRTLDSQGRFGVGSIIRFLPRLVIFFALLGHTFFQRIAVPPNRQSPLREWRSA